MIDTICTYDGRDDLLIAYLYDEIEPAQRELVNYLLKVSQKQ